MPEIPFTASGSPDPGRRSEPASRHRSLPPDTIVGRLRHRPKWLGFAILLIVGHGIILSLMLDTSVRGTVLRIPLSASAADKSAAVSMLKQEHEVRLLILPLRLGIGWLLFASLLFGVTRSILPDVPVQFRQGFSLVVHAEIFNLLARLTVAVRASFFSSGDPEKDLLPPLSLANIAFPQIGYIGRLVLGLIEPFSFAYVLALSYGLAVICRIRFSRAFLSAFLTWTFWEFLNITILELLRSGLKLRLG